jgi:uncharacterized membrane protein YphA (DoxX/SURF4 family)
MSTNLIVILVFIVIAFFDFLVYVLSARLRKTAVIVARVLLGLVFIFSGFVKSVDPMGSMFKFDDYFEAFHMMWLQPVSLALGFVLFCGEFLLGFAFLFNARLKLMSWLMLIFMTFFFLLTFVLAIKNPVSDCGCFGDALILSNWETFYKNISLMIFALIVFNARPKLTNRFPNVTQNGILALGLVIIISIGTYSYRYLPIIDFMHWKIGTQIAKEVVATPEIADTKLIYKNKETGQILEYTSKTLPWKDSVFFKKLVFVEQQKKVIQEYKEAPIHDFMVDDSMKVNHNQEIISNPKYQFLLISYDLHGAAKSVFTKLNAFYDDCVRDSVGFAALCGSDFDFMYKFRKENNAQYSFYGVDATALKSVVRSNPGLVLLKNGVVLDKWAWRCFPSYEKFKNKLPKYEKQLSKILNRNPVKK